MPQPLCYGVYMSTTLTIRTDRTLREALEQRARAEGKSLSEAARDILRQAVHEQPLELRTGHLRGRLRLERQGEEWRTSLRDHNWRP